MGDRSPYFSSRRRKDLYQDHSPNPGPGSSTTADTTLPLTSDNTFQNESTASSNLKNALAGERINIPSLSTLGSDPFLPVKVCREDFKANLVRTDSRSSLSDIVAPDRISSTFSKSPVRPPQSTSSTRSNTSRFTIAETNPGVLVAVVEGRGSARGEIGLASISLSNPTLVLCQFSDTMTYIRTLTKMAILNPSDVLIPHSGNLGSGDQSKLYQDLTEHCVGSKINQIHRKYYNETRGMQMVKHLCAPEYSLVELQLGHKFYALAAAFALLKYMEYILNIVYAPRSVKVEFQASADSTMIDVETAKHVELLQTVNPRSNNSLFGFLNLCTTPGGTRYLRSCLFQPTTKQESIEARLDAIGELLSKPEILTGLQSTLGRFCDIDQLLSLCAVLQKKETFSAIEQKVNHVIGLKHALELIEPLHTILSCGVESKLLADIKKSLEDQSYGKMMKKVQQIIHDEARAKKGTANMRLQRCFAIRSGLNGLLDVARRTYCEIIDDIEDHVRGLTQQHGIPLKLGYNSYRGYHAQISCGTKKVQLKLSDLPKNFLRPQKYRTQMTFTTEEIIKLDQRSQDALKEVTLMSNVILTELLSQIRESIGSLYKLSEIVATLDMLVSLADISSMHGFVRPTFGDSLEVINGKHPILLHISAGRINSSGFRQKSLPLKTTLEVVANDVTASPEFSFNVLTGDNMSGKSTYLKQVVLLQVMAQVGCYVPADSAHFRITDAIYARIGTSDNIECNASTFMLEMKEMSYILSNMTSKSLIIIDELGRGTSTQEGAAICWAIAEDIINSKAFCFLATHFELLTKLENMHSRVKNHYFLAQEDCKDKNDHQSIKPHRLCKGCGPKRNYGIMFAKQCSAMPQPLIERAEQMLTKMNIGDECIWTERPDEVQRLNSQKLIFRLLSLSKLPVTNSLKEKLCQLQKMFLQDDDDDDDDEKKKLSGDASVTNGATKT